MTNSKEYSRLWRKKNPGKAALYCRRWRKKQKLRNAVYYGGV